VETNKLDFEDVIFSDHGAVSSTGVDRYESASSIADDLKIALLAELELSDEMGAWKEGLSMLSSNTWVRDCEKIVERLIQLRKISPLDIVAVSALTERVSLRPLLFSLAIALRKLFQRVVLIDCDLRAPSLDTVVTAEGKEGFIDMVKYGCSFSTAATETEAEGIYVIGAGSHPVSSEGELVGRELERVFHSLRTKADITLASVPPFLIRKQVNPILNCMDGVLLCLNGSMGKRSRIRKGFSALWRSDIPLLGIVAQKSSEVEERQTLVLHAQLEDVQPLISQTSSPENLNKESKTIESATDTRENSIDKSREASLSDKVMARPGEASQWPGEATQEGVPDLEKEAVREEEPGQEKQITTWEPISSTKEETAGEPSRSEFMDSHQAMPLDDPELVEKTLFGKQRQWRQYVVGICVVLGIVGVLALKQTRIPGSASYQMDERMMRSILLPGSDGVMIGDETQSSMPGTVASSSDALGAANGEGSAAIYVEVASRAKYGDAAQDSFKIAGVGLRAFIRLTDSVEKETRYGIFVGPFPTADEARAAVSRIEPLGFSGKPRIITEGVK